MENLMLCLAVIVGVLTLIGVIAILLNKPKLCNVCFYTALGIVALVMILEFVYYGTDRGKF